MTRQELFDLVEDEYAVQPDYPFKQEIDGAVFRHKGNRKWFALLMRVPKFRLGIGSNSPEPAEVLNLKCDPMLREGLMQTNGIFPSYHMNKVHWISVLIEEVDTETIKTLLEISYEKTGEKLR